MRETGMHRVAVQGNEYCYATRFRRTQKGAISQAEEEGWVLNEEDKIDKNSTFCERCGMYRSDEV